MNGFYGLTALTVDPIAIGSPIIAPRWLVDHQSVSRTSYPDNAVFLMSNSYLYEFDVNGIPYQVSITQNGASKYVVSFQIDQARLPECHFLRYQDDPYLPSGTGNEVKVLSRIFSSVAGWALKHKPAAITFRGHTPKQFRVYMRVCERTAPRMGYAVKSESQWITLEKIAIDGAAGAAGSDLKN